MTIYCDCLWFVDKTTKGSSRKTSGIVTKRVLRCYEERLKSIPLLKAYIDKAIQNLKQTIIENEKKRKTNMTSL